MSCARHNTTGAEPKMWDHELSITEPEADTASRNDAVTSIRIVKTDPDTFHVLIRLTWRKQDCYLCTTRSRTEPRTFKHLGRLVEYLEEHFPTVTEVTLSLPLNKRPESWPPAKKRPGFGPSENWDR